jgi:hypothetical protein
MKETNLQPKENIMNKPFTHLLPRSFFIMLMVFSAYLFSGCDTPLPENHFGKNSGTGAESPVGNSSNSGISNEGEGGSQTINTESQQSKEPHFLLGEGWKKHPTRQEEVQVQLENGDYIRLSLYKPETETNQTLEEYANNTYKQNFQDVCAGLSSEQLEDTKRDMPPACYYGIDMQVLTVDSQQLYMIKAYDGLFEDEYYQFLFEHEGKIHEVSAIGPAEQKLEDIKKMIATFSYDPAAPDTPKTTEENWVYRAGAL